MKRGFWEKLSSPILCLAPMADVTDPPFRRIITKYSKYGGQDIFDDEGKLTRPYKTTGGPDILFTEFVSCDGLCSAGKERILKDIRFSEGEHPIVFQIFGGKPENFKKCAKLAVELGFDGIDINMGCPDRNIEKQGGGASLIKNLELAKEIIYATKEFSGNLPVSVKTRLGYNEDSLETWLPYLLETDLAAITIHLRTRKEMSKVPAHWERMKRAVEIRNISGKKTFLLGNGDVWSILDAKEKIRNTGADGAMLGRAIFGNPWLFNKEIMRENLPASEILRVLVEHTKLYEELMGGVKSFSVMKKHYKAYVNEFPGAKELRMKLMGTQNAKEVENIIQSFLD